MKFYVQQIIEPAKNTIFSDQSMLQPVSKIDACVKDMVVINLLHLPPVKRI